MTSLLAIFLFSFICSLILTPISGSLGNKLGAIDRPDERKIHSGDIPRIGGLAMGISFIVTLYASSFFFTTVTDHLILNRKIVFCLIGGFVVFGIGFFDDIKRLGPLIKVIFQIAGVSIAYWGGIRINGICLFDSNYSA